MDFFVAAVSWFLVGFLLAHIVVTHHKQNKRK